ncbi:M15 family metallopeptidase [Echinimonas agarilytica]|uniref:M15 family metallopeptidase n=1 Tax=Echinimonas agarilytica TaxID=1215918 RepID=A0AA41W698_9GAMM|nr:M15 family metallopeptidase [Echinimonas agarilytica]MCM2679288.1 M15 family metallopeptidase [Echinimonas agarilytica]
MNLTAANWLGDDDSHIVWLSERHGLTQETLDAWRSMQHHAAECGLSLDLVSSYRSFDRQLAIWNAKFNGLRPVLDDQNQHLDIGSLSELERAIAILRFSALPGASRHHWGTDLDVYSKRLQGDIPFDLVASEYGSGGPQADVSSWLRQHACQYGFMAPYSADLDGVAIEPWHLSYCEIAQHIAREISVTILAERLNQSKISGKQTLLDNLPMLFERFVLRVNQ